jgi:uncharacterized protein YjbI with pentapeptide repeats
MDDDDRLIQDINNQRRNNGQINLENRDLRGAVLDDVDLRIANLRNVNLTDADLRGADLSEADLSEANLVGARLAGAYLRRANLAGAYLRGANLMFASLRGANLGDANLTSADLRGANLTTANFGDANLTSADLRGANLTTANFGDAILIDVNMEGATLTSADLRGANLTRANLTNADLTDVIMEGATLRDTLGLEPRRRPRIDPNQVHRASANINYPKLIAFLKEKLDINIPVNINYASYINETISNLINNSNETPDKKREQQEGLQRLMNDRLNGFNYGEVSDDVLNSIYYVLEYVKRQPTDFQKIYIDNWLESCITDAYAGGEISCVVGVIERFIFALSNACIFSLSSGENAEYDMINSIIRQNPNVLIPEYIQDWYKLHKKGSEYAFPPETTAAEKKENLRNYLLERLPGSRELIDAKIVEIADNIGYEEDDFLYGGRRSTRRRRKNRKTTKKIRRKSNKKRQPKRRKTMRHAS